MNCPMCTIVVIDTVEDTSDIFAWSVLFSAYNPIFFNEGLYAPGDQGSYLSCSLLFNNYLADGRCSANFDEFKCKILENKYNEAHKCVAHVVKG